MTQQNFTILGLSGTTGFVRVRPSGSAEFYWFWEAIHGNVKSDSRPLILWIDGGPGCSGESANFWEFGPLEVVGSREVARRNGTWSDYFHLLFIDNPLGAGFSFAVDPSDLSRTETQASADMYTTLQALIKKFPDWFNREMYIVGHSYAGHFIPVLASLILQRNKENGNVYLPLAGIAIGDGWTDPAVQVLSYAEFGRAVGIFNEWQAETLESIQNTTSRLALAGHFFEANTWNDYLMGNASKFSGEINVCNYRDYQGYNDSLVGMWLNQNSTKRFLGVPEDLEWIECSGAAGDALAGDVMISYSRLFPALLKEIKVMLYNGQDDFLVNSLGSFRWFDQLDWYGKKQFNSARKILWHHKQSPAGYVQRFERFTRVLVNKAGHLVHHDQLLNGRDMLRRFVFNLPWSKWI